MFNIILYGIVLNIMLMSYGWIPMMLNTSCPCTNQCLWWVPRSEKFRAAVEEDVNTKLTAMQAARDTLRSYMDESKDIVLSGLAGWFVLTF